MNTYEVSIPKGSARYVVGREVAGPEAAALCADVLSQGHALLVTRTDETPEALRTKWESEFYDRDKRGYKRRRFRRTKEEKEWEAMAKYLWRVHKERIMMQYRKIAEAHSLCVNGDEQCACGVLHSRCRLEE